MKAILAGVLQAAIVVLALGALVFLLGEPHLEGRNAHATNFEVYFHDPFLALVYVGSVPFFVGLHRAFGMFGQWRRSGAWSPGTLEALRSIRRCALGVPGFVAVGVVFILLFGDPEDRPQGVFLSLLVTLASTGVALAAAGFARHLERGGGWKGSEAGRE